MTQGRSGAVVGFIIGVLVGLGAALAVAVFVTKVPVPFMNKAQANRSPSQEAAEAQKNKDWDPNAALQGKNPVRPPVALGNTPAVTGEAAKPAPATPSRPETKAPASADPLGDLARARAAAAAPAATPKVTTTAAAPAGAPVDPFTYFVQAGAYRTPEEADAQRVRLSLMGVEAKVTEREQSGRTVYRVRVGPFERREDADRSKDKLDANGVETALVRVQR